MKERKIKGQKHFLKNKINNNEKLYWKLNMVTFNKCITPTRKYPIAKYFVIFWKIKIKTEKLKKKESENSEKHFFLEISKLCNN